MPFPFSFREDHSILVGFLGPLSPPGLPPPQPDRLPLGPTTRPLSFSLPRWFPFPGSVSFLPSFPQRTPPYLLGFGLDTTSSRKTSLIPEPSTALPQSPLRGPAVCCLQLLHGLEGQLVHDTQRVCHAGVSGIVDKWAQSVGLDGRGPHQAGGSHE